MDAKNLVTWPGGYLEEHRAAMEDNTTHAQVVEYRGWDPPHEGDVVVMVDATIDQ